MKISVFGMGYVGCVSAACLADEGHDVIGVDINQSKIELINSGKTPIIEEGMGELIDRVVEKKKLIATFDAKMAVQESEIIMITVGTPSRDNGDLDLTYVERVAARIGQLLANKSGFRLLRCVRPSCPEPPRRELYRLLRRIPEKRFIWILMCIIIRSFCARARRSRISITHPLRLSGRRMYRHPPSWMNFMAFWMHRFLKYR